LLTVPCEQGFTPAAWDVWPIYNPLGRFLLVIFLIICHFVVVTILITVLTNSFMTIASNANEEHQFLFAINTISMVKNDSLFSYVAPGNIIAWMVMPLSYVMPIREYVRLNRTIIKLTHWPLLFCIFIYEKYFLASHIYEPTDLVENHGRNRGRFSFADPATRTSMFSPHARTREESVAGHQKEEALVEVFRRAPDASTLRQQRRQERRKSQTAIRNWMDQNDAEGEPLGQWPTIDTRRSGTTRYMRRFRTVSDVRSAASDPADLLSNNGRPISGFGDFEEISPGEQPEDKDQDGDDELVTNDEDEDEAATEDHGARASRGGDDDDDYFTTPVATRFGTLAPSSLTSTHSSKIQSSPISPRTAQTRRQGLHSRTLSTNTILYAPQEMRKAAITATESESEQPVGRRSRPRSSRQTPVATPAAAAARARSPRRSVYVQPGPSRPRPIPAKTALNPTPLLSAPGPRRRIVSSIDDLNSDIVGMGIDPAADFHGVPASFATQMAWATGQLKGLNRSHQDRESVDRMSRLVLARMKTLEEGFADVVKEMRTMRSTVPSLTATAQNSGDDGSLPRSGTITIEIGSDEIRKRVVNKKGGAASKSDRGRPGSSRKDERPTTAMTSASKTSPTKSPLSKRKEQDKGNGKGKEKEVTPPSDSEGARERDEHLDKMGFHPLRRRRSSF
jgi:hypothetical protein